MKDKLLAGGVFLTHGLLDTLVSAYGVSVYGVGLEGNPIMKWLMSHGLVWFVGLKLLVVAGVSVVLYRVHKSSQDYGHERYYRAGTAGLICLGVLVVLSNIMVIA